MFTNLYRCPKHPEVFFSDEIDFAMNSNAHVTPICTTLHTTTATVTLHTNLAVP